MGKDAAAKRIRALVAERPDLAELLAAQARQFPRRVLGERDLSADEVLDLYIEEAHTLLRFVQPHLRPGVRLLEVGGGLGLFHILARAEGVEVVSVEPASEEFSEFRTFGLRLIEAMDGSAERFVNARAEQLPWPDRSFDIVVSHNVLEHVEDPSRAVAEMYRVATAGGIVLNSCPNYLFPYEPHYRVPIIPGAVGLSGRILWRAFGRDRLWRGLNNITAITVRRAVRRLPGARLSFRHPVDAVAQRLDHDAHFAGRHHRLARILRSPTMRAGLGRVAPELLTPMVFEIRKGIPVTLTRPSGLDRAVRRHNPDGRWLYLGQDARRRDRVTERLGRDRQWRLGDDFHRAAGRLRRPFLDFIARLGASQDDPIAWWSTRCSWKVWTASDFFLLVCDVDVADHAVRQAAEQGMPLLLVVEDPWLLRQLQEHLSGSSAASVSVIGGIGLRWQQVRAILRGVAARAGWLGTTLWNAWRQRLVWPTPGLPRSPEQQAVALFSYPQPESFTRDGSWDDPYLPRLDELVRATGYEVIRFTPPERSGFERQLAQRAGDVRPLILWVDRQALWRSLTARWRPHWPETPPTIEGLPIGWLLKREYWLDCGRSSLCVFRLFFECLDRLLSQGAWRGMAFFYENQPWEKLAVLCARRHGLRTVGIQTAVMSPYYLSSCLGEGEAQRMPLPDVVCTSGPYVHQLLADEGLPADRLQLCGAIRYQELTRRLAGNGTNGPLPAPRSEILVALPIDRTMAEHLLGALREAFPDGGAGDGLRFHIKAHPMCPVSAEDIGFPARLAASTFANLDEAMAGCGLVVFTGSTVGYEALAWDRAVARYRCETLLDVDALYGDDLPVCTDHTLRTTLLALVRATQPLHPWEKVQQIVAGPFAPFDPERLLRVFRPEPQPEAVEWLVPHVSEAAR